jgi:ELWxxDGT repeat protein
LISLKDNVFFTASDYSHGREVWYSDGTAAGTHMVKNINPDSADNFFFGPMNFTIYNGKLYFSAFDGYVRTLWKTDGTTEGTKNIMHDVQIESPLGVPIEDDVPFAIAKKEMYFAGYTSSTGNNLYKYNFNAGSTILVKTLSPTGTYIPFYSESIRSMNDSIYFSLSNAAGIGYDLWRSGGASTNTNIIKSFSGTIDIYNFYSTGKKFISVQIQQHMVLNHGQALEHL